MKGIEIVVCLMSAMLGGLIGATVCMLSYQQRIHMVRRKNNILTERINLICEENKKLSNLVSYYEYCRQMDVRPKASQSNGPVKLGNGDRRSLEGGKWNA